MSQLEADVVIVGYGGAGAAAALTAAQAGADVLVVEKNPEGGGNTRYSGGSMRTYLDVEKATDYIEALCDGGTERDVVAAFVREANLNSDWVRGLGGIVEQLNIPAAMFPGSPVVAFPETKGADGIGPRARVKGSKLGAGIDLWGVLQRAMANTTVRIECSLSATQLLFDKNEGVTGVVAERDGKSITIKARRGVILTCGGFEYDSRMHLDYLGQHYYGLCNPGNTGDGIRMAGEVGADLWHMNGVAGTFGYKFPEFVCAVRQAMPAAGFIYVDQFGSRFMDEPGTDAHFMWAPTSYVDPKTLRRTRIPAYVVFDEDTRLRGPIGQTGHGKISDFYQWSTDNSAEVRKGWIKAGDTPGQLATQIGMRADQLAASVAKYNLDCVAGYDPVFGRAPHHLVPLGRPPYYAVELWPCLFNTQGGPRRNAKAQILDVRGRPIKRLYSAGELGSLWNRNYPGAGNVSEALAYGRIAARNVVAEPLVR